MPKTRLEVARDIAARIKPTEAALDAVIAEFGMLIATMAEAPQQAELPIHAGQKALEQVIAAAALATQARNTMAKAHTSFAATKRRIGLEEVALGAGVDTPAMSIPVESAQPVRLSAVA